MLIYMFFSDMSKRTPPQRRVTPTCKKNTPEIVVNFLVSFFAATSLMAKCTTISPIAPPSLTTISTRTYQINI